jgi:2-phosphosulfolactate phosphatase
MQIDVQLIPSTRLPEDLPSRTVVVFDILRATSVIVQALRQGALEIVPVSTVEEAFQAIKRFGPGTTLLGGERGSRKIEGFDLGNSPGEYNAGTVSGKRVILTTTNGTRAFHLVSTGAAVLAGSFLNAGAVVGECLNQKRDVFLFPSGDEGRFSLEDAVCAGRVIEGILREQRSSCLTDASRAVHALYQRFSKNLKEALTLSTHGRELLSKGLKNDLEFCAQTDMTDLVPVFKEGTLRA